MLGQGLPRVAGLPPSLQEAIRAARLRLRDVVLWGARTGTFALDPEAAEAVTAAVVAAWSLVHGFALLTIDRVAEREVGEDSPTDGASQVIDRFISGLAPPAA